MRSGRHLSVSLIIAAGMLVPTVALAKGGFGGLGGGMPRTYGYSMGGSTSRYAWAGANQTSRLQNQGNKGQTGGGKHIYATAKWSKPVDKYRGSQYKTAKWTKSVSKYRANSKSNNPTAGKIHKLFYAAGRSLALASKATQNSKATQTLQQSSSKMGPMPKMLKVASQKLKVATPRANKLGSSDDGAKMTFLAGGGSQSARIGGQNKPLQLRFANKLGTGRSEPAKKSGFFSRLKSRATNTVKGGIAAGKELAAGANLLRQAAGYKIAGDGKRASLHAGGAKFFGRRAVERGKSALGMKPKTTAAKLNRAEMVLEGKPGKLPTKQQWNRAVGRGRRILKEQRQELAQKERQSQRERQERQQWMMRQP